MLRHLTFLLAVFLTALSACMMLAPRSASAENSTEDQAAPSAPRQAPTFRIARESHPHAIIYFALVESGWSSADARRYVARVMANAEPAKGNVITDVVQAITVEYCDNSTSPPTMISYRSWINSTCYSYNVRGVEQGVKKCIAEWQNSPQACIDASRGHWLTLHTKGACFGSSIPEGACVRVRIDPEVQRCPSSQVGSVIQCNCFVELDPANPIDCNRIKIQCSTTNGGDGSPCPECDR